MKVVAMGMLKEMPAGFLERLGLPFEKALTFFEKYGEYKSDPMPGEMALLYIQLINGKLIYRERLERAGVVMFSRENRLIIMRASNYRQLMALTYVH